MIETQKQIFKPILFNTEMVNANLEGRKTQTRRIIKPQPTYFPVIQTMENHESYLKKYLNEGLKNGAIKAKYQIGDILWVRETFEYFAVNWNPHDNINKTSQVTFNYKATNREAFNEVDCYSKFAYKAFNYVENYIGWKPSLFMPKEACRIFLKVTNVRCERLQDISEEDAIAEGVEPGNPAIAICYKHYLKASTFLLFAKQSFKTLWDSINAKKYPWESNPWVWVYDFERIEKPADFN